MPIGSDSLYLPKIARDERIEIIMEAKKGCLEALLWNSRLVLSSQSTFFSAEKFQLG